MAVIHFKQNCITRDLDNKRSGKQNVAQTVWINKNLVNKMGCPDHPNKKFHSTSQASKELSYICIFMLFVAILD